MGDKCKFMQPRAPRVGDKWETIGRQVGDKLKPHGPEHAEWEASVKSIKIMWPGKPAVWGKTKEQKMIWQFSGLTNP